MNSKLRQFCAGFTATAALLSVAAFAHADAKTLDGNQDLDIAGGKNADTNPGMAVQILNYRKEHTDKQWISCSSTVVAEQWILTAKHCWADWSRRQVRISYRAKTLNAFSGGQNIGVAGIVNGQYDLTLVKLKEPIKDPVIVKLATKDPEANSINQIWGWGATAQTDTAANPDLKWADVKVIGPGVDHNNGPAIVSIASTGHAWKGDSGGPQFFNGEQVGVASTATFESKSQQYASVAKNLDWIKKTISEPLPPQENQAPSIKDGQDEVLKTGEPWSVDLTGPDPEGDAISYSATGLPPGLIIDEKTGLISGTPTTVGSYEVIFTATDARNSAARSKFTLLVQQGVNVTTAPPTTQPITTAPTTKPTTSKPTIKPTTTKPVTTKPTVKPTTKPVTSQPPTTIPPTEIPTLSNGVAREIAGTDKTETFYKVIVPAGTNSLTITAAGGQGLVVLSARKGEKPSQTQSDCRSIHFSNTAAKCTLTGVGGQTIYVSTYGFGPYSGIKLTATW